MRLPPSEPGQERSLTVDGEPWSASGGRRHAFGGGQDHGGHRPAGRPAAGRAPPGGGQGGPGFHRPRLPRRSPAGGPLATSTPGCAGQRRSPPWPDGPRRGRACSWWRESWGSSTAPPTAPRRPPPTSPACSTPRSCWWSTPRPCRRRSPPSSTASPPSSRMCGWPGWCSTGWVPTATRSCCARLWNPVGVPVLGALRTDDRLTWRDRHLGLVPVAERPEVVAAALDRLATAVAERVDLEAVVRLASSAPARTVGAVPLPPAAPRRTRVAVAGGAGLHLHVRRHARRAGRRRGRARPLRPAPGRCAPRGHRRAAGRRRLPRGLRGRAGRQPAAAGRRPAPGRRRPAGLGRVRRTAVARPQPRRARHGRRAAGRGAHDGPPHPRLPPGHRRPPPRPSVPPGPSCGATSSTTPPSSRPATPSLLASRLGTRPDGFATPTLLATYLHHHPGGDPGPVGHFVAACAREEPGVAS